jgi:hypothetical protein
MQRLLKSAKFWTAVIDALITICLVIVGQLAPAALDATNRAILAIQPILIALILAYCAEDIQAARSKADIATAQMYASQQQITSNNADLRIMGMDDNPGA